ARGRDREMRRAQPLSLLRLGSPLVRCASGDVDPPLDPDRLRVAPCLLRPAAEALHRRLPAALERALREEAVRDSSGTANRLLGGAADPDRNRPLDGQRVDAGARDRVPAPVEVDDRLRPESPHHLDLLLHPPPAVAEVLAQRLELDEVPAEPDAETEASAREEVDLGRLLGRERRLALRQDE